MNIDHEQVESINAVLGKSLVREGDDVDLFDPPQGMRRALEIRNGRKHKRVILKQETFKKLEPIIAFKEKGRHSEPWDPFDSDYTLDN